MPRPDVGVMAKRVAEQLANPNRDKSIGFKRRIWIVVKSFSREKSKHQRYFEEVQQRLSEMSATARGSRAAGKRNSKALTERKVS